jgi:hypothetical protein
VAITAGLTGFIFQQKVMENTLKDNLNATLKSQVVLFNTVVLQAENNTRNASKAFFLHKQSITVKAVPAEHYRRVVTSLFSNGFQALAVYDLDGNKLVSAGKFPLAPAIAADLHTPLSTQLLWDGGLYLQTEAPIIEQGIVVARLGALQPLFTLDKQLFDTHKLGNSVEIALCATKGEKMVCFPEGAHTQPFTLNRHSATGKPLPMSFAVDGKSGIIAAMDYRSMNVEAAYAPLAPGVGLVVKEDTAELYAVIRDQLKAVAPVLLVMVMLGALFLRS